MRPFLFTQKERKRIFVSFILMHGQVFFLLEVANKFLVYPVQELWKSVGEASLFYFLFFVMCVLAFLVRI